jgi:hypothetical protein
VSNIQTDEILFGILSRHEPVAQRRWQGDEEVHCLAGDWEVRYSPPDRTPQRWTIAPWP